MEIIYDNEATRAQSLTGWPEKDLDKVGRRGPENPCPDLFAEKPFLVGSDFSSYWQQLCLVGQAPSSQYDILRQKKWAPESRGPLACVALEGRGFHGQHQRTWSTCRGNLHLSLSVPLNLAAGPAALVWTMLPAVAVLRALGRLGLAPGPNRGIKWVNDVIWNQKKLAGVLSSLTILKGRIRRGHLGIGLNVGQVPGELPDVTCLHEFLSPKEAPLGLVLRVVLGALEEVISLLEFGATKKIFLEYSQHSLVIGRQVEIKTDSLGGSEESRPRGMVLGINPDLSLVLEGVEEPVATGRIRILE